MRILVTGSRDWTDSRAIAEELFAAWQQAGSPRIDTVTLVHGGACGADTIAASIASRAGMQVECHRADWDVHGRVAGFVRNSEMVDAGADVCLAFIKNQSRGATHCANVAERRGIETRRVTTPPPDHPTSTGREDRAEEGTST